MQGTLPSNSVLDHIRQKHARFQDFTSFSQGRFMSCLQKSRGMVALCTISTLIFLSSKRCEQGVLIGQEQVIGQAQNNVQSKCKTVILLGLPNEQTCIDEVVGVKWTNNKACCVFCEKNCRDSKSNRGSKVKMTFF